MGAIISKQNHRTRKLTWTNSPSSIDELEGQNYFVVEFQHIKARVMSTRATGTMRSSLENPARKIFELFQRHDKIAIRNVRCLDNSDLMIIYGYLAEPAFQLSCTLLICADVSLNQLIQSTSTPEPHWRYPWTLECLLFLMERGRQPYRISVPAPDNWWRRIVNYLSHRVGRKTLSNRTTRLDPQQNAAVNAGDGVVQVIAPAGSGKTTVLIERVKELKRRGTPAEAILCMSFNRDAKVEIGQRLEKAGVKGVIVRSFHGMSLAILKAENRLRKNIGGLDDSQLEKIINRVCPEHPPSVTETRNTISSYKLAAMITPREALRTIDPTKQMDARIYFLHEEELARRQLLDFDDLVASTVHLLQTDRTVRHRWQQQFHRVLVDEYQDIEPSQALLVGILAAPQDSLFCVGDEDQCIYAWRRATVQRIIELDQVYPGLERHALIRNYRCGRHITTASRKLIQHNRIRFNKPLLAGAKEKGEITVGSFATRSIGAKTAARLIVGANPDEVVVLARTSKLLDEVKTAFHYLCNFEPAVELATIHASKGREWNRVILYGVDEGQTPHRQAKLEKDIEDERRLFYVALTRAKNTLEIICTKGRESRFIREAGLQ